MNFPIIQQHDDLIQAVDAKELYQNLGLHNANWKRWHVSNIKENPFATEGVDYQGFIIMMSGNETQNYLLSIDFAKKLSMQVKTEKGEQVRDYFLECERKTQQPALPDFTNPADAAIAWAAEYKAKEQAQAQVVELQPKADALDAISHVKGALGIREAAKAAGMKQNEFVAWCIDTDKPISARFMYRDYSGALNAYSHRIEQGLITQKMNSFVGNDGRDRVAPQVRFTPAGIAKIAELIQKSKRKELAIA